LLGLTFLKNALAGSPCFLKNLLVGSREHPAAHKGAAALGRRARFPYAKTGCRPGGKAGRRQGNCAMPALATYDRFIEIVRKSGLVDEGRFGASLQQYETDGGEELPTPLATKLVRDGLISTFQAKQLLQGRWRRFLINNKYRVLDLLGQG